MLQYSWPFVFEIIHAPPLRIKAECFAALFESHTFQTQSSREGVRFKNMMVVRTWFGY